MNRYPSKTPRTAIGLAAIALTAVTMGLTVLLPARSDATATSIERATVATATQCINGVVDARS